MTSLNTLLVYIPDTYTIAIRTTKYLSQNMHRVHVSLDVITQNNKAKGTKWESIK